ncbi:DNA replication/repair protein RecF [bacterium]|nr:DNA replication/repair protein RecF [bacterium]
MFLDELKVRNFCNLKSLSLKFSLKLNIFFGDNAQGKTNILDAIYFLNKAKSFRGKKDLYLIQWNGNEFFLKGNIIDEDNSHQLTILLQDSKIEVKNEIKGEIKSEVKKEIRIDNKKINNQSKVFEIFNCVVFSPEDLYILTKSPVLRRHFLNLLIAQVNEKYLYYLRRYQRTLLSRNKILNEKKSILEKNKVLESLDHLLISEGVEIIKIRHEVVNELSKLAAQVYKEILSVKDLFEIKYKPSISSDNLEKDFYDKLHKYREKENIRGFTLVGPHKDDLIFTFREVNIGSFGSQGQKRITAIAIRFAELFYIYKKTKKFPILLLDDVFSDLDKEKKRNFINLLNDQIQIFITTSNLEFLKETNFKNYMLFQVKDGCVLE